MSKISDRKHNLAPLPAVKMAQKIAQKTTPDRPDINAYYPSTIIKYPKYFDGYYYDNAGNAFISNFDNPTTKNYCKVPKKLINYIKAPNRVKQIFYQGCDQACCKSCSSSSSSSSSCCNDSSIFSCSNCSGSSNSSCCQSSSCSCSSCCQSSCSSSRKYGCSCSSCSSSS